MTTSVAFFLSPEGQLVNVPQNHVSTVIADPKKFGLKRHEIDALYLRRGERIGVEGEARRDLLLKVVSRGWIRVRRYPNRYWSVTANELSHAVQEHLREWAQKMLAGTDDFREPDRFMPVQISTSHGNFHTMIGDLAEGSHSQPLPLSHNGANQNADVVNP